MSWQDDERRRATFQRWRDERIALWHDLAVAHYRALRHDICPAGTLHRYPVGAYVMSFGQSRYREVYACIVCGAHSLDGMASLAHEREHVNAWLVRRAWANPDDSHELADALVVAFNAARLALDARTPRTSP